MCNIWNIYNQDPKKEKDELSLQQIEQFLKLNKEFLSHLMHVGFTGGEPLLMREDFIDIVRTFRRILPWVCLGVQTNGLNPELAKEKLKQILSFYPEFSLAVSLDGLSDTHSELRGVPKAFDLAIQTINYAKELGIKRITCGMTLTPYNYKEIKQVNEIVERLGCEFSCFLAEEAEYFANHQQTNTYLFSQEQKKQIAEQLQDVGLSHYFMDNLRLSLQGKHQSKVVCFSGFSSLVIDPYGNVKPCILKVKDIKNDVFGNIKDGSLASILNSKKAKEIKEKIKKCNCWCQCEVSSSIVAYPIDLIRWFLFYCKAKLQFIKEFKAKSKRFFR